MRRTTAIKLAALLLALLVVTGVAGCGKKLSDTTADGRKIIHFWAVQQEGYVSEWWREWTDKFNEQSKTTFVDMEIVPDGDAYAQKLKAAQADGTAPALNMKKFGDVTTNAHSGTLMPMDEYIGEELFADLTPATRLAAQYKGKHYAYPFFTEPLGVLFYRKDLFQQAGLDPNSPPTTWDKMIEYAKKLTTNDRFGLEFGTGGDDLAIQSWQFEYQLGLDLISKDWTAATVTDSGHEEIVQLYQRMRNEKVVANQSLSAWWDLKSFYEGRVAMKVTGSWGLGQIRENAPEMMENVGISYVPTKTGAYDIPTTSIGGFFLCLDGKAKYPENAAEYMKWMLAENDEPLLDFFEKAQYCRYPARESLNDILAENAALAKDPFYRLISEKILPYALPEPNYPFDLRLYFSNAIEKVLLNGTDIAAALKEAERGINGYIEEYELAEKCPLNVSRR